MILKPKTSVNNPKALLYKEYINVGLTRSLQIAYKTVDDKLWQFISTTREFIEVDDAQTYGEITAVSSEDICRFQTTYKQYSVDFGWYDTVTTADDEIRLGYSNITKNQLNKYFYAGTFDYMISGTRDSDIDQPVQGLQVDNVSMDIRTFTDGLAYRARDYVVINNNVYAINAVQHKQVRTPKVYNIYYLSLTMVVYNG